MDKSTMTVEGLMPALMSSHWKRHGDWAVCDTADVAVYSQYSADQPLAPPRVILCVRSGPFSLNLDLTGPDAVDLAGKLCMAADEVGQQHALWRKAKQEAEDVLRRDAL